MSVQDFVTAVLSQNQFSSILSDHRVIPARPASYGDCQQPWPAPVRNILETRNFRLFSHQAEAINYIRSGRSVVVSTPTASGKSLIYNLPVLEQTLLDPESHALYLFPLKALAQDQLQGFNDLSSDWPRSARPTCALYDGDTPDADRRRIRNDPPSVLITNPEMLHLAILPWHEQWTTFLAGLRIIVVDEAHTYRGVFGSNMALVFRRLNRIVRRFGANPVYVLSTATVGNPQELAAKLTDAPPTEEPYVISLSGAPQGARHFFFFNPLSAASTTAISLLRLALEHRLRTIVYCRSRRMTELISLWAGSAEGARYRKRISAYRAGFLPEERREIEAKMNSGELSCVVSTSALELGIDIGGLDICILVGYPGTVMQTLQRGGRVGRARQESCVLLVAGEDALDQYFANNPDDFFRRPPEKAVLNPDNEIIAARHIECAAAEMPLLCTEPWIRNRSCQRAIATLRDSGRLLLSGDGTAWISSRKNPQRTVSLRGSGVECHIEDEHGKAIGSIDMFRAWHETHPGAVYLHRGRSYVIRSVDPAQGRICGREERVSWFTRIRAQKSTHILEEQERMSLGRVLVARGRLRITDQVTAYEKRLSSGNQLLTVVPLNTPPQIFETEGLWYVIPDNIRLDLEKQFLHFMGSIHAVEHAIIGLLPLQVMADRNDFGGISIPLHPQVGLPCIFVYDGIPGGAGLTRNAFPNARQILSDTLRAIETCRCEEGCPSCVHSPKCGSGNRPISKQGAILLLRELLGDGTEGDRLCSELRLQEFRDFLDPQLPAVAQKDPDGRNSTSEEPSDDASDDVSGTASPAGPSSQTGPAGDALKTPDADPYVPVIQEHPSGTPRDLGEPGTPPEHYVVFDVETRCSAREVGGWNRTDRMGVSIAVAYDSLSRTFRAFTQEELPALFRLFAAGTLVIGFNSLRFDYQVLRPFTEIDLWKLPSLDLLQCIYRRLKYRISLDNVAQATLGTQKTADGLQALAWWKENRIQEITDYCTKDVEMTRDIYLFGLEHGYILFTNRAGQTVQLPVDFQPPS